MPRTGSYIAAVAVIIVLVGGIAFALRSEPSRDAQVVAQGPYKYQAVPAGADGPLKPCVVCHSVEAGGPLRVAPPLNGIVGAKKARADWYGYSTPLKKAGGVWTEADLDKFLTSPSKFLPGTTKTIIGIRDDKERADIIAALKRTSQ
jgi:cytochrome c2